MHNASCLEKQAVNARKAQKHVSLVPWEEAPILTTRQSEVKVKTVSRRKNER